MSYVKAVAEAVRDAVKCSAYICGSPLSNQFIDYDPVDLNAIIASVPLPEPVGEADHGGGVLMYDCDLQVGTKIYAEPVESKPPVIIVNLNHDIGRSYQYTLDTSEKIIRDGLIALGWTPPGEQAGWQPIETAPKEKQVLICCKGGRVATARFESMPFLGEYWYVVVPVCGGFGTGSDTRIHWHEDMPTHWMPLPAAPEVKGGAA